jgi:Uma2 family endonuclease
MTQAEFHRAYEQMPERFKAELIGGIVYLASPLRLGHGTDHVTLAGLLFLYRTRTPGVEAADKATVILADDAEPQPDLFLRILPAFGGRSKTTDDQYVEGAPELVIEVAHASRAIDSHAKRADYSRAGVPEYIVYLVGQRQVRWFDLAAGRDVPVDPDGVLRSRQFPGLWIDTAALADRDDVRLLGTLHRGLATPEHAEFVKLLASRRTAG